MSPLIIPIQTDRSELLLKIDSFDLPNTFENPADVLKMGTSEVCDVSLERVSEFDSVDHKALHLISHMLFDFIERNPDNIIYFYCDDLNDLPRSKHNQKMLPQEYRSRLFSALFAAELAELSQNADSTDVKFHLTDIEQHLQKSLQKLQESNN